MKRNWKNLFGALVIAVLCAQTVALSQEVRTGLHALSTAQTDNVSWSFAQIEVELLEMQSAAMTALQEEASPQSIADFTQRFDIFFSRIGTHNDSTTYRKALSSQQALSTLEELRDFVDQTANIIDNSATLLPSQLSDIITNIDNFRPDVRLLALEGVQNHVAHSKGLRAATSQTLIHLIIYIFTLFFSLIVASAVLFYLYRRSVSDTAEKDALTTRFQAAIQASLDAVLIVDTSGNILEFNGAAETIFGYTRSEAIGAPMVELIVPEHLREQHLAGMARYLRTNEKKVIGAGRVRLEALHKSGAVFPVELSISSAQTRNRTVFVSYLRDISAELAAEKELLAARDKAEAGEKAKSELLTIMSHEMRTPLNGILGSLELLKAGEYSEKQQRLLDAIGTSGELLLSHVNDVLDLSRSGPIALDGHETDFDVFDTTREIVESLQPSAIEQGTSCLLDFIGTSSTTTRGNRAALQRILVNLIGNAIKFTKQGEIRVEVERVGANYDFRISDTGLGIPDDKLDHIFDEFTTIDTAYSRHSPGTGLGLPISKRLAQSMGGDITVESIEGEGSQFTLSVPLTPHKSAHAQRRITDRIHIPENTSGCHALVVEDNEINRMILDDMLRENGCTTTIAKDGFEGVECARANTFDIAFIDISMPGKDGLETLADIRRDCLHLDQMPCIATTAHAGETDREKFSEAGFQSTLVKPLSKATVAKTLNDASQKLADGNEATLLSNARADFIARFGREKFELVASELAAVVKEILADLGAAPELDVSLRARVHHESGSAAVLGLEGLHAALRSIETCPKQDWPERKDGLISVLSDEVSTF